MESKTNFRIILQLLFLVFFVQRRMNTSEVPTRDFNCKNSFTFPPIHCLPFYFLLLHVFLFYLASFFLVLNCFLLSPHSCLISSLRTIPLFISQLFHSSLSMFVLFIHLSSTTLKYRRLECQLRAKCAQV
jgi:hypothetical protein